MKKWMLLLILCFMAFAAGACGKEEEKDDSLEPAWLEVEPSVKPEHPQVNETVTLKAAVTYGEEKVEDADSVKFEIWRAHDEEHQTVEAKHAGGGVYQYETAFDREGTYYFIAHVTAENMHNMPKTEFVVGKPSEPEENPSSATIGDMDDEMDEDHSGK